MPSSLPALDAHWSAGYILLSYGIACLGSMVALELMKQRTAAKGTRNHLLLIGGAISLGAIGIWSMHFIGMMALTLHDSSGVHYPHAFGFGLTVVSVLVGVIIVAAGFLIAGDPNHPRMWKNLLAGAAGGLGVSAMHYTGMLAMEGVDATWDAGIVVASVLVGIFAATAAMLIFFRWGRLWSADLRLQFVTSLIMGVAVCGMHYTGMQAATFYPPSSPLDYSQYTSHNELLAAILSLVGGTILVLVGFRLYFRRMLQAELNKASCLTLQALLYDPVQKALLVHQQTNAPPSVVIQRLTGANAGGAPGGLAKLSGESTDFMRMFRASFEWGKLSVIEEQLRSAQAERQATGKKVDSGALELFQKFEAAARALAKDLAVPVELFGKLHWQPRNSLISIVFAPQDASKLLDTFSPEVVTRSIGNLSGAAEGAGATDGADAALIPPPGGSIKEAWTESKEKEEVSLQMRERRAQKRLGMCLARGVPNYRFQHVAPIEAQLRQSLRLEAGERPDALLSSMLDYYGKLVAPIVPATGGEAVIGKDKAATHEVSHTEVSDNGVAEAAAHFDSELHRLLTLAGTQAGVPAAAVESSMDQWIATVRGASVPVDAAGRSMHARNPSFAWPLSSRSRSGRPSHRRHQSQQSVSGNDTKRTSPKSKPRKLKGPASPSNGEKEDAAATDLEAVANGMASAAEANAPSRPVQCINDLCLLAAQNGAAWNSLALPPAIKTAFVAVLASPAARTNTQPTKLAVGLFWSQASGGRSLQVLLPAAGPFGLVPHALLDATALSGSETLFGAADLARLLRELQALHRYGGEVLGSVDNASTDSSQRDVVAHAASMQRGLIEMERAGFAPLPPGASVVGAPANKEHHVIEMSQQGVSAVGGSSYDAERSTNEKPMLPSAVVTPVNSARGERYALGQQQLQQQFTPRGALATATSSGATRAPLLLPSSSSAHGTSSAARALACRQAFFSACEQLSEQVGSASDLHLSHLLPTLVPVAPGLQMALFMCCRMSPVIPVPLRARNVFVPLPIFEVVHRSAALRSLGRRVTKEEESAAIAATGWARSLLSDQLSMQSPGGAPGTATMATVVAPASKPSALGNSPAPQGSDLPRKGTVVTFLPGSVEPLSPASRRWDGPQTPTVQGTPASAVRAADPAAVAPVAGTGSKESLYADSSPGRPPLPHRSSVSVSSRTGNGSTSAAASPEQQPQVQLTPASFSALPPSAVSSPRSSVGPGSVTSSAGSPVGSPLMALGAGSALPPSGRGRSRGTSLRVQVAINNTQRIEAAAAAAAAAAANGGQQPNSPSSTSLNNRPSMRAWSSRATSSSRAPQPAEVATDAAQRQPTLSPPAGSPENSISYPNPASGGEPLLSPSSKAPESELLPPKQEQELPLRTAADGPVFPPAAAGAAAAAGVSPAEGPVTPS